jgi:hypothetical protein
MANRQHADHSPALPEIERPLHPTKTSFDKTNPPVDLRHLKTTTNGINRPFSLDSTRQNCAIRNPLFVPRAME